MPPDRRIRNCTLAERTLYSGEHFDARIGQQYLRARWYDPTTGRFNRLDPFAGDLYDPQSLHKYLYCHGNPVMGIDPTGMFFGGLIGLGLGSLIGAKVDATYNGAVTGAAFGLMADLAYVGFIAYGNMKRMWLGGETNHVNIYVTPIPAAYSRDPEFVRYRQNMMANASLVGQQLSKVNPGFTYFNLIDGSMPAGTGRGYDKATATMSIEVTWSDPARGIAHGDDWAIDVRPRVFEREWQALSAQGLLTIPDNNKSKSMYIANMMLHETAHVILDQNSLRQWFGYRDHKSSGLMAGPPWSWKNMSVNEASRRLLEYDSKTAMEMRAALGYEWLSH